MLFTETDSLVSGIGSEDVYEDFYEDKNLSDFHDYLLHSKFFDPANKKVIGNLKVEFKPKVIIKFGWIKVKIVFFSLCRSKINNKCKEGQ